MDVVMEVVGLQLTPEGDVLVSLVDNESGATASFFRTPAEASTFKLGKTWRVRVTRSTVQADG